MTQIYNNAVPIITLKQGLFYINGAVVSNDATTPNTVLDVSAGIMRDSSNTYDINLGNFNGQINPLSTANSVTLINAAVVGLNGIDAGALAQATVYYVYAVADPVSGLPTGAMISTAVPSVGPLLPFGYSAFRHIGYAVTASGAATFLKMYMAGNGSSRRLTYDAPQATSVTTGASTTYAAINLSTLVPTLPINQIVQISYTFSPAAAGRILSLQPVNATGAAVQITGQVAAIPVSGVVEVDAQIVSAGTTPQINYKVTGAGDIAGISVAGFDYFL